MAFYLEFDPLDQPTQLSKVGNWIITFLSAPNDLTQTQLAITQVIPRQANYDTQIRRLMIQNTKQENLWEIIKVEAFNGLLNQEYDLDLTQKINQELIHHFLKEFEKYDVNIQFII